MYHIAFQRILPFLPMVISTCLVSPLSAGTSSGSTYDYSHRKRMCEIQVVSSQGVPLPGILIGIAQVRNDFIFGGTLCQKGFDTLGDAYGERFQSYFDVATPAEEIRWERVMDCAQKCAPDFSRADFLVAWVREKNIRFRGSAIFSNENETRIPPWTRTLGPVAFKQAMQERIDSTVGRYKGKITEWELISETCHGANGTHPENGMLQQLSGDPDIFGWILNEARKRDSIACFVISDDGLLSGSDSAATNRFITSVTPLGAAFDRIGVTAHFDMSMNRNSYESKINLLAERLKKRVLLTNVDFSFDIDQAPEKIEEIMRTCFANPNVAGINVGNWSQRFMSSGATSFFVDSQNNETACGRRWREVRDEWKTVTGGNTDDSGVITFEGFHGQYITLISCEFDTFYLEPGEGTQRVKVVYQHGTDDTSTATRRLPSAPQKTEYIINGMAVPVTLPARYQGPLFLTTYSLSGRLVSRSMIDLRHSRRLTLPPSSCCRIFRIERADRVPLYTGRIMMAR